MSGWRIATWSTELGRGTIRSALGEITFDAAVADVAEFRIGEEVEVRLEPRAGSYAVTHIAPIAWRRPERDPPRRTELDSLVDALRAAVLDRTLRLALFDGEDLVVAIEPESYELEHRVVFHGCAFVQMPPRMEDVASVRAFGWEDFARECTALVAHWPAMEAGSVVFRLEPRFFGAAPGYIVALGASLRRSA